MLNFQIIDKLNILYAILKINIDELYIFILDDYITKKMKITNYLKKNINVLFYLTIIGLVLAILTIKIEKSTTRYFYNMKGGVVNPTDIFGFLGRQVKNFTQFFVDRVKSIMYFILTIVMIGLIMVAPLFLYLLLIFMMFKYLVKGGMKL